MPLPACVAWMVHVPPETRVTVAPDTVQTAVVVDAKLTARPEDAVADHTGGWDHYLDRLAVASSGGDAGPDAPAEPPSTAG